MAPKNSKEPLESDITRRILIQLRARGGYWDKTHGSPYSANKPDVIGVYKGRYVAIEVKRPSRRDSVTPGQEAILEAVRANGGIGEVVCEVWEALVILDRLDLE